MEREDEREREEEKGRKRESVSGRETGEERKNREREGGEGDITGYPVHKPSQMSLYMCDRPRSLGPGPSAQVLLSESRIGLQQSPASMLAVF